MADSEISLISPIQLDNERVHVSGIRCFSEPQSARLGRITVLVGENSTGKSTFLAVNSMMNQLLDPHEINFNREPFILGSFRDIATIATNGAGNIQEFCIGLEGYVIPRKLPYLFDRYEPDIFEKYSHPRPYRVFTRFISKSGQPTASTTEVNIGKNKFTIDWISDSQTSIKSISIGSHTIEGEVLKETPLRNWHYFFNPRYVFPEYLATVLRQELEKMKGKDRQISSTVNSLREDILNDLSLYSLAMRETIRNRITYAVAPVRSTPKRTYDPVQSSPMPEGRHVPMMLSRIFREHRDEWIRMKQKLEEFGKESGLFRQISVRPLGESASDPFQLTVRVRDKTINLLDVGYGVSQILPIIVDTLTQSSSSLFLLQQPEVHLHPRGQAALATYLLGRTQDSNQKFIVETHSDQIIDRLRIEIRDRQLDPEIFSLLYFEQGENGVTIREIELDRQGNLRNAPASYRDFFLNEEYSLLGIQRS